MDTRAGNRGYQRVKLKKHIFCRAWVQHGTRYSWLGSIPDFDDIALQRYDTRMSLPKRATVYFDPEIHRALRLKAAAADRSISDMVNDAVKLALAEDAEDLAAFEERAHEKSIDFETVVRSLRRRGKI
jgi:hypothetical protein